MPRFYIQPQAVKRDRIIIGAPQSHHIINVLRLTKGDAITLFDGTGHEYQAQIIELQSDQLIAHIQVTLKPSVESPINIILGQAIIKGDKMEQVIQKTTELGVSKIVPVKTAFSRRYAPGSLTRKQTRWQKIATEATQQCGRVMLPQIENPMAINDFCSNFETAEPKLIFCKQPAVKGANEVLTKTNPHKQVALLIGPEGGFDPHEFLTATDYGFIPICLGPRTLRTETAAIAAVSLIQYQLGDLK
jgi:16S rRNA (uracil1498-N3)-methyltransferase